MIGVISSHVAGPTGYAAAVLADNPLAYWRLEETSGTTLTDSSSNARNGTYTGAPSFSQAGKVGTAVAFGTNDYATVADAAWMDPTTATIEFWYKQTTTGSLVGRWGTTTYMFLDIITGAIRVYANVSGTTKIASAAPAGYLDGNWHHVAATYDGTNLILYFDGTAVATTAAAGSLSAAAVPFGIGRRGDDVSTVAKSLDEVAFYGTALPSARVAAHYAAA